MTTIINSLTMPVAMPQSNPFCKTAAHAKIDRTDASSKLRTFVLMAGRDLDPTAQTDRCNRRMMSTVSVVLSKRLVNFNNDLEQPGTIEEIDQFVENTEFLMQYFADNRQLTSVNQINFETVSVLNQEWLVSSGIMYSEFSLSYG